MNHDPPAYFGSPEIKEKALAAMQGHLDADHLVKGSYGFADATGFKGCMIGCLGGKERHFGVSREYGLPVDLCHLFDVIFEGLPEPANKAFTVDVLAAIPVGADLSAVSPRFFLWLLTCPELDLAGKADDAGKAAIATVANLWQRVIDGDEPSPKEWSAAWSAARSAAESAAESAAWSAAWSADRSAAWSAAGSAAWSADRSAAWSAARSAARSAAWSAAWEVIAAELIRLLAAGEPALVS